MNDRSTERLEATLKEAAAAFQYPPTPDLARDVRPHFARPASRPQPAMRWAVAVAMALLLCLLVATAVPPVRAALLSVLQFGAIQINLLQEAETPATGSGAEMQMVSIADLGETISVEEAADLITLRDPTYPPALGLPDAIYGQNLLYREPVISFFWQATSERPQILLTQIGIPQFGVKWALAEQVLETTVSGQPAVWIEGPHLFDLVDTTIDQETTIATNVLIWSAGNITYRLEGDLTLPQARAIAESWR